MWRRGASRKNAPSTQLLIPSFGSERVNQIWKSIYSNQIRQSFSTNMEKCLAFHWICKTVPVLQHISICFQSTKYSSPVDGSVQYIPRNMHMVFALLCFVVTHWLIFPYQSGLLHWHCGYLTIAPVPAKQPWWIWINTSCEFIMNDCITTTKQSTTKPCAYFLGYTVYQDYHTMSAFQAYAIYYYVSHLNNTLILTTNRCIYINIQWSAVISWCNITRQCTQLFSDRGRTWIRACTHKRRASYGFLLWWLWRKSTAL